MTQRTSTNLAMRGATRTVSMPDTLHIADRAPQAPVA